MRAGALFEGAAALYRVALGQEEDALTWSNLGDCLVQAVQVIQGSVFVRTDAIYILNATKQFVDDLFMIN